MENGTVLKRTECLNTTGQEPSAYPAMCGIQREAKHIQTYNFVTKSRRNRNYKLHYPRRVPYKVPKSRI